jgi:glycosyltransferase involved in cell wall biosynthesis
MHIALLVPTLDRIAGAERQVTLLAKGLKRRNHRVSVLTLSGTGGEAYQELMALGIGFISLGMRKGLADPRGWFRMRRWILKEAPDVLHAHLPHAAWMARWSRLITHVPVVVDSIHTTATGTIGRRLGYRLSDRFPDAVTAVSQSVADAYLCAGMVSAKHLHIVPNGVEWVPRQVCPETRDRVRSERRCEDTFLWLAAGRLETVKDYPTLLRAFALLSRRAHLLIAGSGSLEAALRQLAIELEIQARVQFLGFLPDLSRVMQAADAFVLSSLWEGLPMALLEASVHSLPAVATAVPGSRDAVMHERTGLLALPQNPSTLAAAMARLMEMTAEDRATMGAAAHRRITDHFTLDRVLDRWEELYRELLDAIRNPSQQDRRHEPAN